MISLESRMDQSAAGSGFVELELHFASRVCLLFVGTVQWPTPCNLLVPRRPKE
jgi:hypothetical protein